MNIQEKQDEIVSNFELFDDDWEEKFAYIIELGKKLPPLDPKYKTEEFRIIGCQSKVWLLPQKEGENIIFHADSDSTIVKGIVSMLVLVLSGQKASDIATANLDFIERIGLKEHLTMNRTNGLTAMINQIYQYATAFQNS